MYINILISLFKLTSLYPFFSNGSGTAYAAGGSYTANAAATLYAQWRANAAVGDYITYVPSITSATLSTADSGYSSNQAYNPSSTTSWRVFSIDNGVMSIIPTDPIMRSGYGFAFGDNGNSSSTVWNNFPNTLNTIASKYVNPTYATSARPFGLDPSTNLTVGPTAPSGAGWVYDTINAADLAVLAAHPELDTWAGLLAKSWGGGDWHYLAEWLPARAVERYVSGGGVAPNGTVIPPMDVTTYGGYFRYVITRDAGNSYFNNYSKLNYVNYGTSSDQVGAPIRPIVTLKSTVRITGGSGTASDPYTLGI